MPFNQTMEMEESEGAQRAPRLDSKYKLPKTPDFSSQMTSPKRPSPFILDDFRGSDAYRKTKP